MAISSDAHRPLHQFYYYYFIFMIYCLLCFTVTMIGASNNRNKVSALYVFGDSTVDPGNNNYIRTAFKSNFEPYGRDFANQVPTGRFTNGKLGTDFIVSYLGLKEFLPPYLDPNLTNQELITGVSFASAGSGYDPLTPTLSELLREGARKLGVVGLPPMGCLPIMITFNSNNALLERGCVDMFSSVARNHNLILQNQLNFMQLNSSMSTGAKIYYVDIYEPLSNMIHGLDDNNGGFDEVDSGCCGSGYIEAAFLCNRASHLCSDASKYVFWDSIHPTEKAYYNMYLASRHVIDILVNA
ncbi:GDSL esterase/lipase At5g45960-like isoform X4 [Arachis ipaensis]|uniref:GDSL esterase/lipase At5g45960-like isoform X4 n=1 Tax=Arachis ipaensis TaxID=130454 RepID=UPI000A2B7E83|nr:GDSL esterase/lipase At5g45960-like isoform X4 [Arachis ipaensis]